MAFRLTGGGIPPRGRGTLLTGMFGCYDTSGDPDFDMDRDETLHKRSVYEFIRDQLTPDQQAELDQVDEFWRAHPEAFNKDFAMIHAFESKKTALEGFGIADDKGKVPEIPRSHWWWWPTEVEEGKK